MKLLAALQQRLGSRSLVSSAQDALSLSKGGRSVDARLAQIQSASSAAAAVAAPSLVLQSLALLFFDLGVMFRTLGIYFVCVSALAAASADALVPGLTSALYGDIAGHSDFEVNLQPPTEGAKDGRSFGGLTVFPRARFFGDDIPRTGPGGARDD